MAPKILACFLSVILVFCCFSCNNEENVNRPLVAIGEQVLRKERLDEVIPKGLTKEDSLQLSEHFIRLWINDELMYQQAQRNIGNTKDIDRMVEEYRKSLILHTYENQLVAERLSKNISEDEIRAYYREHEKDFLLSESIVKGFILKIPLNATGLDKLKDWCKKETQSSNSANIANIEKYCVQNATIYEYFYDRWEPFDKLMENIAGGIDDSSDFLKKNTYLETQDSTYYYYMNIKEYLTTSDKQPIEFAKSRIVDILSNEKRIDFIKKIKDDLYQDAVNTDKIKIYY
jgi:hypothetical protein